MATKSWLGRLGDGLKAARSAIRFGGMPALTYGYGSNSYGGYQWGANANYAQLVKDPLDNSIVAATVGWVGRTMPEAPIRVMRATATGEAIIPAHPLTLKLKRPNPYYSGALMWNPLMVSWIADGNAYLLKERTNGGDPLNLWYVPHWTMEPKWTSATEYVSYYEYKVDGVITRYDPTDVIHLRNGIDPRNTRKGLSQLKAVIREIYSDNKATEYSAAMLSNYGTPGMIISPLNADQSFTEQNAAVIKQNTIEKTTGDRRGEPIIFLDPIKIDLPAFAPNQMNVRESQYTPEERISAVIGIPAIVVGLGAGLNRCIIYNMRVMTPDRGPVAVQNIEAGDTIWAMENNRLEACHVTWAGKTGHRDVFTVKTPNRTITATDNHPFLVRRMEKVRTTQPGRRRAMENRYFLAWVPLADLRAGDYIVSAQHLPDVGKTTLPDGSDATVPMLEWMGAFVGDGSFTGGEKDIGITMSIPKTDRVRDHYEALTAALFTKYAGGGVRIGRRIADGSTEEMVARWQAGESYRAIARDYPIHNASVRDRIQTAVNPKVAMSAPVLIRDVRHGFAISSASASRWLRSLGFQRGARLKRVPPWVFTLTEELRLAFMRGLLDTDGSVDKRGLASFTFASEELTWDAWHLAVSCGLRVCNVRHGIQRGSKLPNAGLQDEYDYWTFTITGPEDVRRIGTHDEKYQRYLAETTYQSRAQGAGGKPKSAAILPEGCVFTKVQAITPAGTEDVYDLTIDSAHNFIAQGLIVHNSTYSNTDQMYEAAYRSYLIPVQRLIAEELTTQLLPDFGGAPDEFVQFDYTDIRALQADEAEVAERAVKLFSGSVIDRARAVTMIGDKPKPEDKGVYYLGRGGSFVDGAIMDVGPAVDPLLVSGEQLPGATAAPHAGAPPAATNGHTPEPIPAASA